MKVIRKIIKNPPSQKQQFGTSHLLVTFGILFSMYKINIIFNLSIILNFLNLLLKFS